jgi:hypothetical protein
MQRFNAWLLHPNVRGKSQSDMFRFPWENQKTAKLKTGKILNGK